MARTERQKTAAVRLTAKMLVLAHERARAEGERMEFHDSECPGLVVRVGPRGIVGVLRYYSPVTGERRRLGLGRYGVDHATIDGMRAAANGAKALVARGVDPQADKMQERAARRAAITLGEAVQEYLSRHARQHKKPASAREDERHLTELLPKLGGNDRPAKEVTRGDIARVHAEIGADHPVKANRCLAVLKTLFGKLLEWELLPPDAPNPCALVKKYREESRSRFLSVEELGRIGSAIDQLVAGDVELLVDGEKERLPRCLPSQAAALKLLLLTGMRLREVTGLRWREIDVDHGAIVLDSTRSKTGAKRIVLPGAAIELLDSLPREVGNPHVFAGAVAGKGIDPDALRRVWLRVLRVAGIGEHARIHDIRHSVASVGAAGGIGLPLLGAMLGHRQSSTTAKYAHLSSDPVRQAADSVANTIAAALCGKARENPEE